jgi:hypothetical protein
MRWVELYGTFVDEPQALAELMVLAWTRVQMLRDPVTQERCIRAGEASAVLNILDSEGHQPGPSVLRWAQSRDEQDSGAMPFTL